MYNRALNENYLSTRVCLHESPKPKSSIPLPRGPDLFAEDASIYGK